MKTYQFYKTQNKESRQAFIEGYLTLAEDFLQIASSNNIGFDSVDKDNIESLHTIISDSSDYFKGELKQIIKESKNDNLSI